MSHFITFGFIKIEDFPTRRDRSIARTFGISLTFRLVDVELANGSFRSEAVVEQFHLPIFVTEIPRTIARTIFWIDLPNRRLYNSLFSIPTTF